MKRESKVQLWIVVALVLGYWCFTDQIRGFLETENIYQDAMVFGCFGLLAAFTWGACSLHY